MNDNQTATFSYALNVPDDFRVQISHVLESRGIKSTNLLVSWFYALNKSTNHDSIKLQAWMESSLEVLARYPTNQHPAVMEICEKRFREIAE